ncbi:MAG TPA: UDP-2,3-diacylglucosamine diphosphatase LpxI [Elusimicrobiales bacterium]|nr:UDP-2,3-diacylglucosamine diphosphatase LpxI [Elusimicrobiales bacterium]
MAKIGLIAGAGEYPVVFAQEAARNGCQVYTVGLEGHTDARLEKLSASIKYFKLGQISAPIKFLRDSGVERAVMAGLVRHGSIFALLSMDLRAAALLARLPDFRAESVLGTVVEEFAKDGIEIISSATFLEQLLPRPGVLGRHKPDSLQQKSIDFGVKMARKLAEADIGLTAVVCDRMVVALEAMEGTDACIIRGGELYRSAVEGKTVDSSKTSGLVVVKAARPRQDFRYDLPVIGMKTLDSMLTAGSKTLAVEAGKTILLSKDELLARADAEGISITAF